MQTDKKETVVVLGAGNFGTCLAQHLATVGHNVKIWARDPQIS
ncbi:MAG: glycerol-3-phosphate dehydrogenase, partial [Bdellovibrionota bacterium]